MPDGIYHCHQSLEINLSKIYFKSPRGQWVKPFPNVIFPCVKDPWDLTRHSHYGDVIMGAIASQITSLTVVYSTVYSDADQRKHQSSVSLAFVWGIHRGPVNSPHKWPVTRKMFSYDDVFMRLAEPPLTLSCFHCLRAWGSLRHSKYFSHELSCRNCHVCRDNILLLVA